MSSWFALDWHRMFVPSAPLLETVIRGSCMYLALFGMLRLFRRQTGGFGAADLLVLLLIADAAQNGLAGDYHSITDGILLVATIVFWEYVLDWAGYCSKVMERVLEREPLLLIRDGEVQYANLKTEFMTRDDLASQLRKKGVRDEKRVKLCYLEGDGHVSVVTDDDRNRSDGGGEEDTHH